MSDVWSVLPSDAGSPLLNPLPPTNPYEEDTRYDWDTCPIDNAPHNSCFFIPGVTNAPSSPQNNTG